MIRIRKLDIYFFKKSDIKSNTLRKCKIRIFQPGVLRLTNAPPRPHRPWSECAGVSGCRCEFPGVSGCRCEFPGVSGHRWKCIGVRGHICEGGGRGTPDLPGPVLREGKLETGSVLTAKRPRPGSSADTSKCSSPHRMPPPAQRPAARTLPASRSTSLSWSSAQGSPPPAAGWGGRAGAPRQSWSGGRPARSHPSLLGAPRPRGAVSVSVGDTWTWSPWARVFVTGRCSRGARCWGRGVHVGRGGSAGVKRSLLLGCARVMGAHSSGILFAGRRQRVFWRDSVLFPKAFWRIGYKG